jgi:hypothetical protein
MTKAKEQEKNCLHSVHVEKNVAINAWKTKVDR